MNSQEILTHVRERLFANYGLRCQLSVVFPLTEILYQVLHLRDPFRPKSIHTINININNHVLKDLKCYCGIDPYSEIIHVIMNEAIIQTPPKAYPTEMDAIVVRSILYSDFSSVM
jgi:hypothetical protein